MNELPLDSPNYDDRPSSLPPGRYKDDNVAYRPLISTTSPPAAKCTTPFTTVPVAPE